LNSLLLRLLTYIGDDDKLLFTVTYFLADRTSNSAKVLRDTILKMVKGIIIAEESTGILIGFQLAMMLSLTIVVPPKMDFWTVVVWPWKFDKEKVITCRFFLSHRRT